MPASVQEGDLLAVSYAGDGNLSALRAQSGDLLDWNLHVSQVVSNTLVEGFLFKWADGTEGGQTLIASSSPSEKWCVEALSIYDAEEFLQGGGLRSNNTGSSNPNQGSYSLSATDHLLMTHLAGEGATTTTGIPSGYTGTS